jgi:hypothetical protein
VGSGAAGTSAESLLAQLTAAGTGEPGGGCGLGCTPGGSAACVQAVSACHHGVSLAWPVLSRVRSSVGQLHSAPLRPSPPPPPPPGRPGCRQELAARGGAVLCGAERGGGAGRCGRDGGAPAGHAARPRRQRHRQALCAAVRGGAGAPRRPHLLPRPASSADRGAGVRWGSPARASRCWPRLSSLPSFAAAAAAGAPRVLVHVPKRSCLPHALPPARRAGGGERVHGAGRRGCRQPGRVPAAAAAARAGAGQHPQAALPAAQGGPPGGAARGSVCCRCIHQGGLLDWVVAAAFVVLVAVVSAACKHQAPRTHTHTPLSPPPPRP